MLRNGIASSNRTFMELKSQTDYVFLGLVLCSNRTFMELKWYIIG